MWFSYIKTPQDSTGIIFFSIWRSRFSHFWPLVYKKRNTVRRHDWLMIMTSVRSSHDWLMVMTSAERRSKIFITLDWLSSLPSIFGHSLKQRGGIGDNLIGQFFIEWPVDKQKWQDFEGLWFLKEGSRQDSIFI